MKKYTYVRNNEYVFPVWGRKDLKGKQDQYLLCCQCKNFSNGIVSGNEHSSCNIYNTILNVSNPLNVTIVVWECGNFTVKGE